MAHDASEFTQSALLFRAGLISTVSRIERENTRRFEILGVSRGDDLAP